MPTPIIADNDKFSVVINKNTFYFYNRDFENHYESYINSIRETLILLKAEVEEASTREKKKAVFEKFLETKENGLRAILSLTGFSNESLKRLITLIRVVDEPELSRLSNKEKWTKQTGSIDEIQEWSDSQIEQLIQKNQEFRRGLVNVFFEGSTVPFLVATMKPFELRKLSFSKMRFDIEDMIDTLVRYKEKGSYSGKKENNAEEYIRQLLGSKNLTWETGDLAELVENAFDQKRTMDFIIPSKSAPQVIVECSYLMTTSSGQGDKAKAEISVNALLKKHYPNVLFIGFVDGIGWYVRKGDLRRMVSAYDDVFTFHSSELERFSQFLDSHLKSRG